VHLGHAQYQYEIRRVSQVTPGDTAAMLQHEELPWLTLVTCMGFNPSTGGYQYCLLVGQK